MPEKKRVDPSRYKPKMGTTVGKIAELLDWAAEELPHKIITYPQITKAVMGYPRMPRQDSKEVELIRSRISGVRQKLVKDFDRDIVTESGIGCRATVDSADILKHCVTKRAKRLSSANTKLQESISIMDEEGLLETNPDLADLVSWLQEELKPLIKKLQTPKSVRALLPPVAMPEDEEEE